MFTKLKQFKDMRSQAKKMQGALANESVTARSAGDSVVLTMNGNLEMVGLAIADDLLNTDKRERLQNAIKEAHGDALKKMQRIMAMKMKEMGGLPNMPGM